MIYASESTHAKSLPLTPTLLSILAPHKKQNSLVFIFRESRERGAWFGGDAAGRGEGLWECSDSFSGEGGGRCGSAGGDAAGHEERGSLLNSDGSNTGGSKWLDRIHN